MKRKVDVKFDRWVRASKKALLVSGARQVGKTYSIRECLKRNQCDYVEINLIEEPDLIPVLDKTLSVDDMIINLSAAANRSIVPGKTIIFIDEVQELKDIITRIKFWVDDGRFRFILSGSLLGIELRSLRSAPVGYIEEYTMYPLDFEEFLIASGVPENVLSHLKECFHRKKMVGEMVHQKMMKHFYRFLVTGGMPDPVREYVESGNMNEVSLIQKNIISLYRRDFTKYEEQNKKLFLEAIYDVIPANLLKQNKRFNYADLRKGLHYEKVESSFIWLTAAGVAIPVYNTTEPRLALSQNQKSSLVKLYGSDVGLLTFQYGNATRVQILAQNDKINLGGVFENAVAVELNTHGFPAFFYNSHRLGELDFLIEYHGHIVPIEVKSGKDYYVHSALNHVLDNKEYEIEEAYIFADCEVSVEGKKNYMPIYLCTFMEEEAELPVLGRLVNEEGMYEQE